MTTLQYIGLIVFAAGTTVYAAYFKKRCIDLRTLLNEANAALGKALARGNSAILDLADAQKREMALMHRALVAEDLALEQKALLAKAYNKAAQFQTQADELSKAIAANPNAEAGAREAALRLKEMLNG